VKGDDEEESSWKKVRFYLIKSIQLNNLKY
jgi:hypothetical protein